MPLPAFIPPCAPSPGLTDTPEVTIQRADFGDGYTQSSYGLNNVRSIVEASWDILEKAEAEAVVAFFAARKGAQPFTYAFPHRASAKWTVEAWSDTIGTGDYHKVAATFRQSFTLAT